MSSAITHVDRNLRELESHSHKSGLRTVAVFEAIKGVLALVAAFLFIMMLRQDVDLENAAENLLYFLHIDPDRRMSQAFLDAAGHIMETKIHTVIVLVLVYVTLRFVESYGLWNQRAWAEWLAIISGCIYLPFELVRLVQAPNAFHWAVLLINIGIVIYIAWVRWSEIKLARARREAAVVNVS